MPTPKRCRADHTRTFTGCRTCRARHAKCDEGKPECGGCIRSGVPCGGYTPRLSWVTDVEATGPAEKPNPDSPDYRYSLFSDLERRTMCERMLESLKSKSAGRVLTELDSAAKRHETDEDFGISKGPFSAFKLAVHRVGSTVTPPATTPSEQDGDSADADARDAEDPDGFRQPPDALEWCLNAPQADFDSFLATLDLSMGQDEAANDTETLPSSVSELLADIPSELDSLLPDILDPSRPVHVGEKDDAVAENYNDGGVAGECSALGEFLSPALLTSPGVASSLPEQAQALLRYYKQQVESSTKSVQARQKSPWRLLFLPCAFETFAELSLMNATSHTRLAILCAILAHSAFQLHRSDSIPRSTNYWGILGVQHRDKAQYHLRNAVSFEVNDMEQTKYQELLMAFIAMAMISLYQGNHTSKIFLLDAERLIRVRGLVDQKPEMIRVLHHVYTYLRVIAEGIYGLEGPGAADLSLEAPLSRTFRLSETSLNIGLDPSVEKASDLGYGDIHLEVQGMWAKTLHSRIHGIPESLMTLFSQTISLANEKEHLEARARFDPQLSVDLKHHIKTLEERLWSWDWNSELNIMMSADGAFCQKGPNLLCHPCTKSMVQAIHQSVIIYFYRRIHDVSAMVLQDLVRQALNCLESCISEMVASDDFALGLAWAAYVCARESVLPELQEKALKYVCITDSRGLYFTSKPSAEVVTLLWGRNQT